MTDDALIVKPREVCASRVGEWLPFYLLAQVHLERGDAAGAVDRFEQIKGPESATPKSCACAVLARATPACFPGRIARTFEGHNSYVTSVRLSQDGKLVLSGMQDDKLKLWETRPTAVVWPVRSKATAMKCKSCV